MGELCIIGMGPWGLCSLERLVDAARRSPTTKVNVHVVEPNRPGGGLYAAAEPDYFVLNTPCGQHSMYPYPAAPGEERLGKGFYEWATDAGYRWEGTECRVSGTGDPIGPGDFLPRRLMGEYLEWFYAALVDERPANVTITHHPTSAIDIVATVGGRERVVLADGTSVVADHVVVTTGQVQESLDSGASAPRAAKPYPSEQLTASTAPGEKVAIEGMGLVAVDVVTAFTLGLGGRYSEEADGRLRYHPSGREPLLYLYSRSGFPYCAKSLGAADPMGDYEPAFCTWEAVTALKGGGGRRQMDARRELLPLIFAEMELCYYTCAAHGQAGPEAARAVRANLVAAWAAGTFDAELARCADSYGTFRAADYFFIGDGATYPDGEVYQARVYRSVLDDATAALVPGGTSPLKAALETLRALRDIMRLAVEFKGLTLESHVDFQEHLRGRFARLIAGPPAVRSRQFLALVDAGVLHLPFGPAPQVRPLPGGGAAVRSTRLERPFELRVDRLVRAHIDPPSIAAATSALLANLARQGRVRPLSFDGTPVGSIDLANDFHPFDVEGVAQRRLWVFGVLTEGVRYFTLYIPSPKSRARAFADAGIFAAEVVAESGPGVSLAGAPQRRPLPTGTAEGGRVRIALVNNMPDAAFAETEEQFLRLLGARAGDGQVEVERYTLPGIIRGPEVQRVIADGYGDLGSLWGTYPDAVVVTGAEPKSADICSELYWPALNQLLWWARSAVPSVLLSCLSAHAALLSFDQLNRRLLWQKCSGVFDHTVDGQHPLMAGIGALSLPHSRFNEVSTDEVVGAGYQVLARSADAGWAVAVAERGQCEVFLLQGHPEYAAHTLLREYRRDVRRYLSGNQGSYPHIPTGYLEPDGVEALVEFHAQAATLRDPRLMEHFPYELAARYVRSGWDGAAQRLMGNWLRSVRRRASGQPAEVATLAQPATAAQPAAPHPAIVAQPGQPSALP